MGDLNINILNCNSDRATLSFIDTKYSNSFYPTINIPSWITSTSKTLIDNILYNNITKRISAGNIVTSISDHFTQYIFIPSEISEKPNSKIFKRKYTVENLKKFKLHLIKLTIKNTSYQNTKKSKKQLPAPLTYLINLAFQTGIFPDILTTAKVIPILKKKTNKTTTITDQSISYQIEVK